MVQTLEAIRGGGGSIKVGTTGTISALMSRELESIKSAPQAPVGGKNKSPTICPFDASAATTPRKMKSRPPMDEASSSNAGNTSNQKSADMVRKTKHYRQQTQNIPILDSENMSLDGTPVRQKPEKKGPYMVEVVDVKCGNADKTWAIPITNRLKKLGFSKLSENII